MLNPPLSLLPDDLLSYLVEHVAELPTSFAKASLYNLSLADPAFTDFCQKYIFRTLTLGGGNRGRISKKLSEVKRLLDEKPLLANRIRRIELTVDHRQNAWLFENAKWDHPHREDGPISFISILQLLAESPMPPHELFASFYLPIENPIVIVENLSQSFLSQTLTNLELMMWKNVPLTLFLAFPRLKKLRLTRVRPSEEVYDKYPDDHCSSREPPALEVFDYCNSHKVVTQMMAPPAKFHTPVVLWSKLRVLTFALIEEDVIALLHSILDAACTTLEELSLIRSGASRCYKQFPLINLSGLSRLRIFTTRVVIMPRARGSDADALRDINIVLGTIPASNTVTNLSLAFDILDKHPFGTCLDEDWVGICDEVKRISSGKALELDLNVTVLDNGKGYADNEKYVNIMEKTTSLLDFPNICTHFGRMPS
ncbi:hypothetical protein M413DRAFT_63396 [Hebeloma cylindrosporum]|uniref:F-box domain-containing protein n=1 Tax=Hebeloma cylindrosporum TaxID=76867 RepID=A0A0C3CSS3_HEBCY|nr:hypothetical protein M413DRAFT_63396 [Hebeloma cylindrosporum h7]